MTNLKQLAHRRMSLNGHKPGDFDALNDKRDMTCESLQEQADFYNYQAMKRAQIRANYAEYERLYQGLVAPTLFFKYWLDKNRKIRHTYYAQWGCLLLSKLA